jgi:hypothetical protein
MAIRTLDAPVAAALEVDPPVAGALVFEAVGDDEELDEHPPITAATAATAITPAAMRARSNLDMVLTAPFERKALEPIHVDLLPARLSRRYLCQVP